MEVIPCFFQEKYCDILDTSHSFSQAPVVYYLSRQQVDRVIPTFQVEPPQGGTVEEILESTYPQIIR